MRRKLFPWVTPAILIFAIGGPASASAAPAAGEKGKIEIELRLMFWAVAAGAEDLPSGTPAPTAQVEDIRDMFLRRGRVILRAQASPRLEVYAQLGQDNAGSKVLRDDAGFRIKDLYLNYRRAETFQVMVGQFKVPFLRQNLESGFDQLFVDRAALPALRPALEGNRDQGGMIWGSRGGFHYRVATFDGSDQEDGNSASSPRGVARVSWNWFTPETGVGYTGTSIGEKRILQLGAQADIQNHRLDSKDESAFTGLSRAYRAWAADLFYDQPFAGTWALTFEGAWLERRDDYDGPGLDTRAISGYYAQAGLLLPGHVGPGRLQLVGRYEDLDT
ncbi:MAG: hypothetical protein HYS34_00830, partial [Acidobacteria bacterium]|nr:hypothetical protein [Acidobacteriota bacterium]